MRTRQGGTAVCGRGSRLCGLLLLACIGAVAATAACAADLNPSVLPRVDAATFEVVAAKATHDPLTYEKPLPLDLLPYQERTDKYHSIGTAFALGHNRYVTAGHVLLSGLDSLWGPPGLRDASGHVYVIDKIEKFSLRRDFVVFSLAQQPAAVATLPIDAKPALNQTVYAVGNALGTGVVIRDGLYTSNTPEQQDGQWKWMRFSAAASPGNSGGPLLDQNGAIIGVVLMKSPNENLNYALPISEVLDAPADLAVIDKRTSAGFQLFDTTITGAFKAQFALPMSLADFNAKLQALRQDYDDGQLKALLAKDPDEVFPRGVGSHQMLYGVPGYFAFPTLLSRNSAGEWQPNEKKGPKITLSDNGFLAVGAVGHTLLFHLRKPDNVSDQQLYGDPARLMDTLAKLGLFRRDVATEHIKITGFGKPGLDTLYTDHWGRHWQVRTWPVPFANHRMMVFALPVPDGYDGFVGILPASDTHEVLANMEAMSDFFYLSYHGTLAQWKAYLTNTTLLPAAIRTIHVDADYDKRFSYASQRVEFSVTPQVQKIQPDSELTLEFMYFPDHGKVVWDVADIRLQVDAGDKDWINIQRNFAPAPDLDQGFQDMWHKVVARQHPWDGVARNENDLMEINGVVSAAGKDRSVLYSAFYATEGDHPQDYMKAKLGLLMKNLHVRE
ncbi:MAG TPA: trypsin-like peptidase domain-containing protein [Rhodanobacteraceae bacterium]|nr:trypsin-like peptidase domain-containing protein [Rhodanobacteraceae bacterium]